MAQVAYFQCHSLLVKALFLLLPVCTHSAGSHSMDESGLGDITSLLQVSPRPAIVAGMHAAHTPGNRDLAMAYVPYNFGHTVAEVARRSGIKWGDCGQRAEFSTECLGYRRSNVTGCPLMYTPGKLWPRHLAEAYFGNRTVFGILRDPYERLVAQFRGSGLFRNPILHATCNVNAAVKAMMREYITQVEAGKPYSGNCEQLPQAEFFDQPYGATVAVDNRRFPISANELLMEHGYNDVQIAAEEVNHVNGCNHVWAGDLDSEARALVRQAYARDFELLCKHFGYCDFEENTCITHVPGMCPPHLFTWSDKDGVFLKN